MLFDQLRSSYKEANVLSQQTQQFKGKAKGSKGSAHQQRHGIVPSKRFAKMILDEQKYGERREVSFDRYDANERLLKHLDALKRHSQGYLEKIGALKNEDEAMAWLLHAAASGDAVAQHHLGLMYEMRRVRDCDKHKGLWDALSGIVRKLEKDDIEAMFWFTRAAEQRHAESMLIVGMMFDAGRGRRRNRVEAIRWILKAADHGSESAMRWLESREG